MQDMDNEQVQPDGLLFFSVLPFKISYRKPMRCCINTIIHIYVQSITLSYIIYWKNKQVGLLVY